MKKIIPILFFSFALILLGGCMRDDETTTNRTTTGQSTTSTNPTTTDTSGEDVALKDGKHVIDSETWDEGHERVILTVEDGKITDVEMLRFDAEGNEIEISEEHEYHALRTSIRERVIESQSADDLEDLIENTSKTTTNWLKGIGDALVKAGKAITDNDNK